MGSGFTASSENILGTKPPLGKGLAEEFERQLDISDSGLDLKTLSDELNHQNPEKLYQTLYNTFNISNVDKDVLEILNRKWLRIFTTNYDNCIEQAYHENGLDFTTFDYDNPIPRRIPTGSIVHIHGSIRKMTESNVLDQLVLNENAYIRQHFQNSPWYGELDRSLDHCTNCFFLGYSLSDYHIAALLMQKPWRKSKIFFITLNTPNPVALRQIEQFGEVHPIGVNGFAELCRSLPAPPPRSRTCTR